MPESCHWRLFIISTGYYKGIRLIIKYVHKIFPEVDLQLKGWTDLCGDSPDEMLMKQALSSISSKRFHAQGGSVYALYPNVNATAAVRFIVALQTISDYLDNLCDRAGVQDESAFRQLHLSMLDAVDPERKISDYYKFYPFKSDNGYLQSLVQECREQLKNAPSYPLVVDSIKKHVQLYTDLQSYKHLQDEVREDCLKTWAGYYAKLYPDISWWEFSAAAGSTLGIFMLYSAAFDQTLSETQVASIENAYFPWICGLHILLDYYIDSYEDMHTGDLNFTYYYKNLKECEERLTFFIQKAFDSCYELEYPEFHTTVVSGLLCMYLSDPKAFTGMNIIPSKNLIEKSSLSTRVYFKLCRLLRKTGTI